MNALIRCLLLVAMFHGVPAHAATFTVTLTNVTGAGSLQQAMLDANSSAGPDLITFNIPGDGPHVLSPSVAQPLPSLTDTVTIDGYTQPGASPNTLTEGNNAVLKIQLDGTSAGQVNGLRIASSGNVIRGLSITRFRNSADGINIASGTNNVIEGNYLGIAPAAAASGNGRHGITITSSGNVIGGTNPAAGNVISGNLVLGVRIQGANNFVRGNIIGLTPTGTVRPNSSGGVILDTGAAGNTIGGDFPGARNVISGNGLGFSGNGVEITGNANNNIVQGNFIGVDFTGTAKRINFGNGIFINNAFANRIGGTNPLARNVISGNNQQGIRIQGNSYSNQALGNVIGTDVSGTINLNNRSNGVFIVNFGAVAPYKNTIGSANVGGANIIAFNSLAGVFVSAGTNNAVRGNTIFSNLGLGLDVDTNGVTPNDLADADSGANLQQNFPLLTNAIVTRTNFIIQGSLNSVANTAFQVDLYANTLCDGSGQGQGRWWLGAVDVTTGPGGEAGFSAAFTGVSPGTVITATATDPLGNTSEFSPCVDMSTFAPIRTFLVTNTNDSGPGSLRQALLDVNQEPSQDTIQFNIPGGGVQTIKPLSALPVPLDPLMLDGYTQPGTVPNTLTNRSNAQIKILLDGSLAGAGGVDGLHFTQTRGNVLRGLAIIRFSGDGIEFEGGGGNRVQDVWLGLAPAGPAPLAAGPAKADTSVSLRAACTGDGNGQNGILVVSCEESYFTYAISSCNSGNGILFSGSGSINNTCSYTCAGGDPTWLLNHGNGGSGIACDNGASGNTFNFCSSGSNDSPAYKCAQSDRNTFSGCTAGNCPGNAFEIDGSGNAITGLFANSIMGHAVSIDSGTGNTVDFQQVHAIKGKVLHVAAGAQGGQSLPTAVSTGVNGPLMRMSGTVSGTDTGQINFSLLGPTAGCDSCFGRIVSFTILKSGESPVVYGQTQPNTAGLSPGDKTLMLITSASGTREGVLATAVMDTNPDMQTRVTEASTSVQMGQVIKWTVTWTNNGLGTAACAVATITFPFPIPDFTVPGAISVEPIIPDGTLVVDRLVRVKLPPLAPGEGIVGTFCAIPTKTGNYTATATVTVVGQTDGNSSNDTNTLSRTISAGSGATPGNVTQADGNAGDTLDPVSTLTGELFEFMAPDLVLGGPMPLGFSRYYASFLQRLGRSGSPGHNWRHNYEWVLTNRTTSVDVVTDLGRLLSFTNAGGVFLLTSRTDIPFQLLTNGNTFLLGDPRTQRRYTFNANGQLTEMADGRGNAHTLTHAAGRLASVTDGLGRALTFAYSPGGSLTNVSDGTRSIALAQTGSNLTTLRDALGFVMTYRYDLASSFSGLLTNAVMPEGNVPYSQTYDASGRVLSQTEAGSNVFTLSYATRLTTVTDPLGRTRQHIHTATGELLVFTDENSLSLGMGYNTNGQRTAVSDRLGNLMRLGFHAPSGYVSGLTNADGTFTTFTYTNRVAGSVTFHDLSRITYPDGRFESYTYDASGNVLTRTDRAGSVSTSTYNARGQVLTAQNPLGGVTTFTYHANGTLASRADTDTGTTTFAYDAFSRLTNVVHPDGTMLRSVYDANDRVTSITDERNKTYTFTYDDNGNVLSVTDPLSQTAQFAYDTRDRLLQATDRLGKTSSRAYDPLDQITSRTNRNGNVTRFTYDTRRRMTSVTDPGNQVWNFGYDDEDLLTSASNPLNQTNRIRRDELGYATGFTNAAGEPTTLTRDSLRRVRSITDALLRTNGFGYDARGLLTNSTKPSAGTAAYERNSLGLLSRITDLNGSQWRFGYTPMGRAAFLADPLNRTNRFDYDSRGRRARTTFPDGHSVSNSFDAASNLTRRQYADGTDLLYSYDALNRLVATDGLALAYDAEDRVTNTASSGVNFGAAYDPGGRLTSVTYNGGAFTVTYTYDTRDRLVGVSDSLTGTMLTFAYDDAGRLTGLTRPNGVNGTYTYDAAGRLTRIQEGALVDLQYTLDPAGQVTNLNYTVPLDPTNSFTQSLLNWVHDAAHQIGNFGHAYDARGRMTNAPGRTFRFDDASRLTQVNAVTLAYNGLNDIVDRVEGGVTNRHYYNLALGLNPIVAERNLNTGQFLRFHIWSPGGALLYMIDAAAGNAVRHFHFDRVGTTLALTDAAGAVTDSYANTPYGELLGRTGTSQQPFLYVGRFGVRSEPGAKLYHMRARYYDPLSGRFLTRDPIWPVLSEPMSLDPYQYAADNPLSFIDPLGLFPAFSAAPASRTSGEGGVEEALGMPSLYGMDNAGNRFVKDQARFDALQQQLEEEKNRGPLVPDYTGPLIPYGAAPRSERVQLFMNRVSTTPSVMPGGASLQDSKDVIQIYGQGFDDPINPELPVQESFSDPNPDAPGYVPKPVTAEHFGALVAYFLSAGN